MRVNLSTGNVYRIDFKNGTSTVKQVKQKWDKFYDTLINAIHPDDRKAVAEKALFGKLEKIPKGGSVSFTYRSTVLSENYRWYTTTVRASSDIISDGGKPQPSATVFTVDVNDEIIERARLKDLSEHDGLTDLFNRVKYETMLETDYRDLRSCGVLFFDVNYLKRTNDTKGHTFGDELLMLVADSIRSITNRHIHGYRYGGDEFIVIACNVSAQELDKLVKMWNIRLGTLISDRNIQGSAAVGKAWSEAPISVNDLISEADRDMYRNKQKMKNGKDE